MLRPRASSKDPIEAEAKPLPREEMTPPVTNMNLGVFVTFDSIILSGVLVAVGPH